KRCCLGDEVLPGSGMIRRQSNKKGAGRGLGFLKAEHREGPDSRSLYTGNTMAASRGSVGILARRCSVAKRLHRVRTGREGRKAGTGDTAQSRVQVCLGGA